LIGSDQNGKFLFILVTFFGVVIVMTSLICSKDRFRHNQFDTPQFGQITQL